MESSPSLSNSDAEKSGDGKGKKKSAELLGSFAVLPDVPLQNKKSESLFGSPDKPKDFKEERVLPLSDKPESAEAIEKTPPLEQLTELEKTEAYREIARARTQELNQLEPASTEEQQEADTAAAAYVALVEKTGDPEAAVAETTEALNLEVTSEIDSNDTEDQAAESVLYIQNGPEDEPDDEDTTVYISSSAAGGTGSSGSGGGSGNGAAGSGPGAPPPNGPYSGGPSPAPGPGAPLPPFNPNFVPPAAAAGYTANALNSPNVMISNSRNAAAEGLLVGGIVGYLIGRRRGRIKTEKRLLPVQKKLEKQVKGLQKEIEDNELAIRRAALQKHRQQPGAASVPLSGREKIITQSPSALSRERAKASSAIIARPERIGHVLIAAELPKAAARREARKPASDQRAEKSITIDKQMETLSRQELLATSSTIIVEGASLRQIYETNLISEKALRRLVAEHLKGGNVSKLLRKEIIEREIDFERDPILRDRARTSLSGGGKSAVTSLVRQAGLSSPKLDDQKDDSKKPAAKSSKTDALKQQIEQHKVADIALLTTITLLVITLGYFVAR